MCYIQKGWFFMNLNLMKTLKSIERSLSKEKVTIEELKKTYEQTLRLKSQLISVIYDMEHFSFSKKIQNKEISTENFSYINKRTVTLVINESLPPIKRAYNGSRRALGGYDT